MEYSKGQVEALAELRKRFFERGFTIFNLKKKHRKHEAEFVAVIIPENPHSSAVVRLYRGKVRIRFFEVSHPLPNIIMNHLVIKDIAPFVVFDSKPFNPTCKGNKHFWNVFCYQKEYFETDPMASIKRAGVHVQKGFSAVQAIK